MNAQETVKITKRRKRNLFSFAGDRVKFEIEVEPIPQARARFGGGRCYESSRLREYKKTIAKLAKCKGAEKLQGAVKMTIRLYRKFKATSRRFGDFDNLAKAICDSLNGVCYVDDSQVVSCKVEKIQSATPKIEIEIESC